MLNVARWHGSDIGRYFTESRQILPLKLLDAAAAFSVRRLQQDDDTAVYSVHIRVDADDRWLDRSAKVWFAVSLGAVVGDISCTVGCFRVGARVCSLIRMFAGRNQLVTTFVAGQ